MSFVSWMNMPLCGFRWNEFISETLEKVLSVERLMSYWLARRLSLTKDSGSALVCLMRRSVGLDLGHIQHGTHWYFPLPFVKGIDLVWVLNSLLLPHGSTGRPGVGGYIIILPKSLCKFSFRLPSWENGAGGIAVWTFAGASRAAAWWELVPADGWDCGSSLSMIRQCDRNGSISFSFLPQ